MVTKPNLPHKKPQDRRKHPDPWERDLNPRREATGTTRSLASQPVTRPASEIKRLVRALQDFTRDELEHIPVVEPGSRLRARAVYVNIGDLRRQEFRAPDDAIAGEDTFYVEKASVARPLWNRLIRVKEPERDKGFVSRTEGRPGTSVARKWLQSGERGAPRAHSDDGTRLTVQGDNELRGGRERSERRGAGAVHKPIGIARHRHARPH